MLTKVQTRISVVPTIVNTAILMIGAGVAVIKPVLGAAIIALGIFLLGLATIARRKSSTTFERILTLSPKDERDEIKIQWGFALVGKITLVFMTLLGLATIAIFGTSGIQFTECHRNGQATACNLTEPTYFVIGLSALVAFFALSVLASAIVSSLKRD
jgi:hypothetical protein